MPFTMNFIYGFHPEAATIEAFCKKSCSKNVANFTGIHLCWSLFLIKLQARPAILQHRCFPVKFATFLRTSLLKDICERLLPFI